MGAETLTQRRQTVRNRVSADEWQIRVDLAAAYRLMARYAMTDLIYNHITARIPGTEHILINSYGMLYEEITASSLFKIDIDGNIALDPGNGYGINYPGYVIHSAVHSGRPDAGCVIHAHMRATMAVSSQKRGLLPLTQTALRFHGRVSYHEYEGPAVDLAERARLIEHLGDNEVMLLRNHGALAVGRSIPDAFNIMYFLEMACRAQIDALAGNQELIYPSAASCSAVERSLRDDPSNKHGAMDGMREWPAMLRQAQRIDPSFAD
jgi:ribulose-5-phosphate 4-epimerase/fuculose-1-phosphate aldolase